MLLLTTKSLTGKKIMSQQLRYTVDIVLCIDATGSMGPVIGNVKSNALKFYQDLRNQMTLKGKTIDHLRVKVIVFRDFFADGHLAFKESPFYSLPSANSEFSAFIQMIYADGGGDEPESGLEALAVAIGSKWNTLGDKKRQVIVMWTDTSAHKLEKGAFSGLSNYPANIPKNFDDLTVSWSNEEIISQTGKRILLYSPAYYPWKEISEYWDNSIHFPSTAGQGLSDIEYDTIIDTIAGSL